MAQIDSLRTEKKFKKTEIGEIPVDWGVVTLDEISQEIYRYPTYYNIKYVKQGIPEVRGELIRHNGILETDLSKYRFISSETALKFPRTCLRKDDFVISVRGTMGKVAIVSDFLDGANMTANLMRISPDRNKIFPMFFHQVLISEKFRKTLNITSSSTTIKTIKAPELKGLKFVIPPLSEQKKIAEILSTVDQAIEKSNEIVEKTKQLKKGLMQELLTKGIGHKEFTDTEIGRMPKEWEIVRVQDISLDLIGGGTPSTSNPDYWNGELAWMTSAHINEREVKTGQRYITKEGLHNSSTSIVPEGNLLVATRVGIGKAAINKIDIAISQDLMGVIINKNRSIPNFVYWYLMNNKNKLKSIAQGSTIKGILKEGLGNLKLPLPPLSEQNKVTQILSSVDEEIEEEMKQKENLEILKKGLMQVLLTGKVRVKV